MAFLADDLQGSRKGSLPSIRPATAALETDERIRGHGQLQQFACGNPSDLRLVGVDEAALLSIDRRILGKVLGDSSGNSCPHSAMTPTGFQRSSSFERDSFILSRSMT